MKVTDALIRSAQELLFDALSDVDADKVIQNITEIFKMSCSICFAACRKFYFRAFLRRITFARLSNCPKLAV